MIETSCIYIKLAAECAVRYLAIVEVRIASTVEDHCIVAHHEQVAAHVVQRRERSRHDVLPNERQIHRLFYHLGNTQVSPADNEGE